MGQAQMSATSPLPATRKGGEISARISSRTAHASTAAPSRGFASKMRRTRATPPRHSSCSRAAAARSSASLASPRATTSTSRCSAENPIFPSCRTGTTRPIEQRRRGEQRTAPARRGAGGEELRPPPPPSREGRGKGAPGRGRTGEGGRRRAAAGLGERWEERERGTATGWVWIKKIECMACGLAWC